MNFFFFFKVQGVSPLTVIYKSQNTQIWVIAYVNFIIFHYHMIITRTSLNFVYVVPWALHKREKYWSNSKQNLITV